MTFKQLYQKAFVGGQWSVAWRRKDSGQYAVADTPENTWIADPFLYEANGEHYLFVELYETSKEKACIAYYRFVDGAPVYQGKIIEQPYHMSYPCIFEYKGNHYIIPESSANQTIDLYMATDFPQKWEKIATLASGHRYVDTTVFFKNDALYAVSYYKSSSDWQLEYFSLDMELKKLNHICSKQYPTNIARPAGGFYEKDGLVRPAQDCSRKYGEQILLYRADCTDQSFDEHMIGNLNVEGLKLSPKPDRVHTLNADSLYECVDVYFEKVDLLHGAKTLWRAYLKKFF